MKRNNGIRRIMVGIACILVLTAVIWICVTVGGGSGRQESPQPDSTVHHQERNDGIRFEEDDELVLGGEYLGFGPSAASDFAGKRFTIRADLMDYIEGVLKGGTILSECEDIPSRERAGEYLMLRLRTVQGIDTEEYTRRFLLPSRPIEKLLERFREMGFVRQDETRYHLTPKGMLISNKILAELMLAQEKSEPLAKKKR